MNEFGKELDKVTVTVNIDRQKSREERTERESRGRVSPKAVELSVE